MWLLGAAIQRVSGVRVYGRFAWQAWGIVAARARRCIEGSGCNDSLTDARGKGKRIAFGFVGSSCFF